MIGIYKGCRATSTSFATSMSSGFDITGFYPVSRDSSLRLVEFDCVMINRAAA